MLYSGEIKSNGIGSDGRVFAWKKTGKSLSDRTTTVTVKHGGGNNLIVWGSMGWNEEGVLTEVEDNMDAVKYCEILGLGVEESCAILEAPEVDRVFQ